MKILMVANELTPLIKTGGLADVVGALASSIAKQDDIRVAIPAYPVLLKTNPDKIAEYNFQAGTRTFQAQIFHLDQGRIPVYLVHTSPGMDDFANYPIDPMVDTDRFVLFNLAILSWLQTSPWQPEIIHVHDWMGGALIAGAKQQQLPYKTILTIHNIRYHGSTDLHTINNLGIQPVIVEGKADLLATAIANADKITTVSPTYAQEIVTSEFGSNLDSLLRNREKDLTGILNGLDQERFSPQNNRAVSPAYNAENVQQIKPSHKKSLQQLVGLPQLADTPIFGMVTRISSQKGLDILSGMIENSHFASRAQLVLIAGHGPDALESRLLKLQSDFPDAVSIRLGFNDPLSLKVYAGSDFILMPSKTEPCGLTQLIGMKFGAIPVVRRTGGLLDTVPDISANGLGITFDNYTAASLYSAIERALKLYGNKSDYWQIVERDMKQDLSWGQSIQKYIDIYRELSGEQPG